MSIYEKLRVKRRDLADTQARMQELEAELANLTEGAGYAKRKADILAQHDGLKKTGDRLNGEIRFLTTELQPRLL